MAAVGPYVRAGPLDARLGAGLRLLGGAVHRVPRVLVDRVEGRLVHPSGNENLTVGGQRVPGQPLLHLGGGTVLARVGAGVTAMPVRERLDERRAAAVSGPADPGQRRGRYPLHG